MDVESNQTIPKKRFIDWFTRKTQKVSLKPVRMGTKPAFNTPSSTRKSRKSVVPYTNEPMSWVPNRATESPKSAKSINKSKNISLSSFKEKECDMMSIVPAEPTNCSYMGNLAVNTFLHSYLSKTPDNSGWVLDLSTGKPTVGIDMGKQNCEKIRKNLKKLIPYIKCDIVKKIHMILMHGHEFRKRHLPILYFLFKVFESVNEIHFGISEDFVLTDKIKDEFGKKGISIGIGKDGSGKRYLKVIK